MPSIQPESEQIIQLEPITKLNKTGIYWDGEFGKFAEAKVVEYKIGYSTPVGLYTQEANAIEACENVDLIPELVIKPVVVAVLENGVECIE